MFNKLALRGWGWAYLLLSLPRASSWRSIVRQPTKASLDQHVSTRFGNMHYRKLGNMASRNHALFIHGLGSDSSTCLPSQRLLDEVHWIIPDLAGHGMSCKPLDFEPYTMKSQAEFVHQILSEQGVKNVFIIGHSLGGPIAIKLCERIIRDDWDITLNGLIYEVSISESILFLILFRKEGNINEDDCFGSKKILEKGCPEISSHSDEKQATDFAM